MKDFALDPNTWDLETVNRDQRIISGSEALVQRIRIKLGHICGEWFLDTSGGSVNFGMLGKKNPNLQLISGIMRGTITRDPEITRLKKFVINFDKKERKLYVEFIADSVYGEIRRKESI